MKKLSLLVLIAAFALSCDDKNDENDNGYPGVVPIKHITAISPVDMTQRTNWDFFVSEGTNFDSEHKLIGNLYNYTVINNRVIAVPKSKEETSNLRFCVPDKYTYCEDRQVPTISILLKSPQYPEYSEATETDQSTKEKLLAHDILSYSHFEETVDGLSNLQLKHRHTLIELKLPKTSEAVKVTIRGGDFFNKIFYSWKPYSADLSTYMAIVNTIAISYYSALIEKGGESYEVPLPLQKNGAIPINHHYTFTIGSKSDGSYEVLEEKGTVWSDEIWSAP